jgi:Pro-kumamolisin, activation domain/Domain of unknown function (DUF5011)/Immunoglobulin I-set domain/Cadherin-like domain
MTEFNRNVFFRKAATWGLGLILCSALTGLGADTSRLILPGHVPKAVARLAPTGLFPTTNTLNLAIGLPLRNQKELGELIRQLYDPGSTHYHQYLSVGEFTARFGPTAEDYEAVRQFAESNGLTVHGTHPNRLVLEVAGNAADIERAFQITLRTYHDPIRGRDFFAADTEPSVPANLSVAEVEGLNNYSPPRPLSRLAARSLARPLSFNGSGPNGEYAGKDFRNAYAPGTTLTGAGQAVGLFEFSSYFALDITNYENIIGQINGRTNYVPITNVVVSPRTPNTANNIEVALDIELCIAMAPGLSRVIVYEEQDGEVKGGTNYLPSTLLSRMASDNLAKQLSCSWTWGGGPSNAVDNALMEMQAQGQSFFQAAGDSDAYTGTNTLDDPNQSVAPVDSTNVIAVGGTSLTMSNNNGTAVSYISETVWNYNNNGIPDEGSGGGISSYYTIPWWQNNVSMAINQGSTTFRNLPDVALTADNVFACYNDGTDNGASYLMGTSCAAPLWAAYTALVNQQSAASGHPPVGFLNPEFYAIGTRTNYDACFNDITSGNNIGANTPGFFNATSGYDLCTGWGTPTGTNLINALAPYPGILAGPTNQTVANGNNASFTVTAGGQPALTFDWLCNGTNLASGGNVSGTTSNVLTLTTVTTNNTGNYSVVVTNNYGSITSSVATLTIIFPPVITISLTNQTIQCGSNAAFSVAASGSSPLNYKWSLDGATISGATSASLSLTNIHVPNHTVTVVVTNAYGSATNSATLAVVDTLAPVITLLGANPLHLTVGSVFVDPGATASDLCAGAVPVTASWLVNTNAAGTYTVTYTATDGNDNTNTATRTVIVQPFPASATLASSENPSGYKDSISFRASMVPTNATGTIQFLTNGTAFDLEPLVSGAAVSAGVSSLPRATNLIVAVYSGDANDLPATNTLSQIVTNHPPMAAPAFYSRLAGYPLNISVANLATNWSDADGDTISLAAIGASTNGVTVTNNAGTLIYFNTNNVNDQFFCTITDGFGGTNIQTVNIAVVLTNLVPNITGVAGSPGSGVTLNLSGAPGSTYVLEATTNLVLPNGWVPLTTNMPGTNGLWQFTDADATNYPNRFYRLILPP